LRMRWSTRNQAGFFCPWDWPTG